MASSGAPIVRVAGVVRSVVNVDIPGRVDYATGDAAPADVSRQLYVDTAYDPDSPAGSAAGFAVVLCARDRADLREQLNQAQPGDLVEVWARAYDAMLTVRPARRDAQGVKIPGSGRYRNEVQFSVVTVVNIEPGVGGQGATRGRYQVGGAPE